MSNLLQVTDESFESEIIQAELPALVDFWAEWCGPCHMLTPVITELADEYAGKVKVGKVNVDDARQTAMNYGIQNIPTVMLFEKGKSVESFVGVRRKGDYQAAINATLGTG